MIAHVAAGVLAGAATSVGPCAVPRYLALAGVLSERSRQSRLSMQVVFYLGTAAAYASLAFTAGAVTMLVHDSEDLQWLLCLGFVTSGLAMLVVPAACSHQHAVTRSALPGGAFLAGFASSCTMAPCCAPVLLAFAALTASGIAGASTAVLLVAFLVGHLAPTWLLGEGLRRFVDRFSSSDAVAAVRTIGAACMIALGMYYGVGA